MSQQLRLQLTKVCKKHYCEKKLTIMYCNSDNIQRMYACQIIEITATFPNNVICLHYIDLISEKKQKRFESNVGQQTHALATRTMSIGSGVWQSNSQCSQSIKQTAIQ